VLILCGEYQFLTQIDLVKFAKILVFRGFLPIFTVVNFS
jgi:hypothetical protein